MSNLLLAKSEEISRLKLQNAALKEALGHEIHGNAPCSSDCVPGGYAHCVGCDIRVHAAFMDMEKPGGKCVCGGVPMNVACEPGCPNYSRKCEAPKIDGNLRCSTSGCDDPAVCGDCFGCKAHCYTKGE